MGYMLSGYLISTSGPVLDRDDHPLHKIALTPDLITASTIIFVVSSILLKYNSLYPHSEQ